MTKSLNLPYLSISRDDLDTELRQLDDEGRDVAALRERFDRLMAEDLAAADPSRQAACRALLEAAARLPARPGYPYVEPSDLEGIRAERTAPSAPPSAAPAGDRLRDKLHGAWLGRACGCLLGKPVEGWRRPRIWGLLKDSGRWPLRAYFTADVPPAVAARYDVAPRAGGSFIEQVEGMPEDDDMNYAVLGLEVLEEHGGDFTPSDVGRAWLRKLPILRTYSAERVAYRNLVAEIPPPESATVANPHREWIGAQIRADAFGYAAAGRPQRAAELAWRDACVSHVKNGIYGEMWVAAMLAAAFVSDDLPGIVRAGLGQIPRRSRMHEVVSQVLRWHEQGMEYDQAVERIHQRWDESVKHHWCGVLPNAAIVTVGLLWGRGEFGPSVCRAVQCCFDTDCNGASVGSVLGAILGAGALPAEWTRPVRDTLLTGVAGSGRLAISALAERTAQVFERLNA